ncbi:hypothetical protein F0Q45_26165, partial [Mycobacterium simiae]
MARARPVVGHRRAPGARAARGGFRHAGAGGVDVRQDRLVDGGRGAAGGAAGAGGGRAVAGPVLPGRGRPHPLQPGFLRPDRGGQSADAEHLAGRGGGGVPARRSGRPEGGRIACRCRLQR